MFYDIFLSLCEKNHEKPTPVLKLLNLSPGNLDKWKNGATVNSEVLLKMSTHFGVSIDYLLGNEQKREPSAKAKGFSKEAVDLLARIDRLSPANRAKLSELIDLYLSAQDKKK